MAKQILVFDHKIGEQIEVYHILTHSGTPIPFLRKNAKIVGYFVNNALDIIYMAEFLPSEKYWQETFYSEKYNLQGTFYVDTDGYFLQQSIPSNEKETLINPQLYKE